MGEGRGGGLASGFEEWRERVKHENGARAGEPLWALFGWPEKSQSPVLGMEVFFVVRAANNSTLVYIYFGTLGSFPPKDFNVLLKQVCGE